MAHQRPTVICVGLSVQDLVFSIAGPLASGEKNLSTAMCAVGGGPATNAAVAVAALGGHARLVSKLGTDTLGDSIVSELSSGGVDVSMIRRLDGVTSPVSCVVVDEAGERTIVNFADHRLIDGSQLATSDELEGSDAVVVDLRWPDGALSAIEAATALGIPSIVDFDVTTTDAPEAVIRSASHVVFARTALAAHARTTDIEGALRRVAATTGAFVAVTLGPQGVAWVERDEVRSLSAFSVPVVDTLGAGDVFHGAFAFAIAVRQPVRDALRFASATAALKCSRPASSRDFPTHAEVDRFLGARP